MEDGCYLTDEERERFFAFADKTMPGPACHKCRFWHRSEEPGWDLDGASAAYRVEPTVFIFVDFNGSCHRYPPTLAQPVDCVDKTNAFPLTMYSDWCGEYQPAVPQQNAVSDPVDASGSLQEG